MRTEQCGTSLSFIVGTVLFSPWYLCSDYLMAQMVKNSPAMWEICIWSLGWDNPLEKRTATHFSILAWEFHGYRSLAGYSPWGHRESDMTEWLSLSHSKLVIHMGLICWCNVSNHFHGCCYLSTPPICKFMLSCLEHLSKVQNLSFFFSPGLMLSFNIQPFAAVYQDIFGSEIQDTFFQFHLICKSDHCVLHM